MEGADLLEENRNRKNTHRFIFLLKLIFIESVIIEDPLYIRQTAHEILKGEL